MGDQGAAARVADKDHESTDPPEAASDALHVALERVQAMLGAHHFVPVRLQCGDQLLEACAISPKSVGEYDARFVLICHSATPDLIWLCTHPRLAPKRSRLKLVPMEPTPGDTSRNSVMSALGHSRHSRHPGVSCSPHVRTFGQCFPHGTH